MYLESVDTLAAKSLLLVADLTQPKSLELVKDVLQFMTVNEKKDIRVALVHNPSTTHPQIGLDHLAVSFIKKDPEASLGALIKAVGDMIKIENIDEYLKQFVSLDSNEITLVESTRSLVHTALSLQAGQSALLVNGRVRIID
jgi:hypothetical protein